MKVLLLGLILALLSPAYAPATLSRTIEPIKDSVKFDEPEDGEIYVDEHTKYYLDGRRVNKSNIPEGDYKIVKVKFRFLRFVSEIWLVSIDPPNIAPMPRLKTTRVVD